MPVKQLNSLIWQTDYQKGDFTGHIYLDAQQLLAAKKLLGASFMCIHGLSKSTIFVI